LNNKISHTAAFVAVKFFGMTLREPFRSQFDKRVLKFYDEIVRQLPPHLSWYKKALNSSFWRKFFIFSEELLLPGDLMHIVCRKYYMSCLLQKALQNGCEQVVVLGSGFDHLAWSAAQQEISSFEIDTGLTAIKKKEYLSSSGMLPDRLHLVSLDVSSSNLFKILTEHPNFSRDKSTVFVAEGFFDYLNLDTAVQVLRQILALSPKARLLSTIFSLDELNFFYRSSFTSGVAMVGESIKLPLDKNGFIELLEKEAFDVEKVISYRQMQNEFIRPLGVKYPVLKGFYVVDSGFSKR